MISKKQSKIVFEKGNHLILFLPNEPRRKQMLADDVSNLFKMGIVSFSIQIESTPSRNVVTNINPDWKHCDTPCFDPNFSSAIAIRAEQLIIIDIDDLHAWKYMLKNENQPDPDCVRERTPKGLHLYFRKPKSLDGFKTVVNIKYSGKKIPIDVITGACMCTMAPSSYVDCNGQVKAYEWIKSIHAHPVDVLPGWLTAICMQQ